MTPPTRPTAGRGALLAVVFGPLVLLLAVVLIANVTVGLAFEDVMEDPAGLFDFHPLTGVVSQLGILIWWSAAVACLVTAALIAPRGTSAPERSFLLWSGVITAVLVLDDLFLFHEDLAERYLGLGQRYIVVAYVVIAALYVARFRSVLTSAAERWLLAASVGLLAMSLATDYVHERVVFDRTGEFIGGLIFVEDALKLLGIAAWTAFFIRYGHLAVAASHRVSAAVAGHAGAPAAGPANAPPGRHPPSSRPQPLQAPTVNSVPDQEAPGAAPALRP
jgi:hypothetical protein